MTTADEAPREQGDRQTERSLYLTIWRWHFYAGLAVLPFLLWLAVTGSLYLYKPEIEGLIYAGWNKVPPANAQVPLDSLIQAVERQGNGSVVQVVRPADAAASWRMTIEDENGGRQLAFVDPYRARILGTTGDGGLMQTVRGLHSLTITGPVGNAIIEMVAGWTVLLVLSGLYLWWPRGGPALGLRGRPAARLFWRDLHASTGILATGVILFLAITGMPWTGVAGKGIQSWVAAHGLGRPKAPGLNPWEAASGHRRVHHDARETLPWSLQQSPLPAAHGSGDVGAHRISAIATANGLVPPWTMTIPATPETPYLVSRGIERAEDARVLYIEASSGKLLQDSSCEQFGIGARTIEWGIATHQGQQYGEINRFVMLLGCLSILLLTTTAPVLWWKRRRGVRLQSPPRASDRRTARRVSVLMIAAGAMFPLTGASMLAVLLIDRLLFRSRSA